MTEETPADRKKRKQREASLKYYHANRDRLLEANRQYRRANKDRLYAREKSLIEQRRAALREADPDFDSKRLEKRRSDRARSAEDRRRYGREYYLANRERILLDSKAAYLKRTYGLTPEQHAEMLAVNNGLCWVCDGQGGAKELSVDHCHKTGEPRGILCFHCNTSIGKLGDTAEGLRKALAYLERFEASVKSA